MKIFSRVVLAILILIIIVLGLIHFVPGYGILFVRSESMMPDINLGDVVVTGPVDGILSGEIEPGKVITYEMGKNRITHRVLSFDGGTIITKGDALEEPDPRPVSLSQVRGIVFFRIPYVGYLSSYIRTRNGWFLAIILPAVILVLLIVKDIVKEALESE